MYNNKITHCRVIRICVLLVAMCVVYLQAEDYTKYYNKKNTWRETLLSSYMQCKDGMLNDLAIKRKQVSKTFVPIIRHNNFKDGNKLKPVHYVLDVRGIDTLYVGHDSVILLDPVLVDVSGKRTVVTSGKELGIKKGRKLKPKKCLGVSYERTYQPRKEMKLSLGGKYTQLEFSAFFITQRGGLDGFFYVDVISLKHIVNLFSLGYGYERNNPAEIIAMQMSTDFGENVSLYEQDLELRDIVNFRLDMSYEIIASNYISHLSDPSEEIQAAATKVDNFAGLEPIIKLFYKERCLERLEVLDKTIVYVEKKAVVPDDLKSQEKALRKKCSKAEDSADWEEYFREAYALRRSVLFLHPDLGFDQLLINKNPPPKYSHNCDQYLGRGSRAGEGLIVLEDWQSESIRETQILKGKMPRGAYAKPDISFDAKKVVFAFAEHGHVDESKLSNGDLRSLRQKRRFFIWEAALDGSSLRQITGTQTDPLEGLDGRKSALIEDGDPAYLPSGEIVFVSSRCQNFGRCHDGRYSPSFLLYKCDENGEQIQQISSGELNETDPAVLHDGRILFTRWEYVDRGETAFHKLWATNPDGSHISHYYGNDTLDSKMIAEAMPIADSDLVVATAMGHHTITTGSIITVDIDKGENGFDPITKLTPEITYPEGMVREWGTWPTKGSYSSPYPVNEDLFLVSHSVENVRRQLTVPSSRSAGIYLIDSFGGRELIYRDRSMSSFSPTPIRSRQVPPVVPSALAPTDKKEGIYIIQNAYLTRNDPDNIIQEGEIKYLRVLELIVQAAPAVSRLNAVGKHEIPNKILGTVPVNDDGSVAFKAPAGVPLHIQILDKNKMALMSERTLHYLQPGEVRSCIGCHEPSSTAPKPNMRNVMIKDLTPPHGPQYDDGLSFGRTVQPVLDRHCISCHGLDQQQKPNLLATRDGQFTASYKGLSAYAKVYKTSPNASGHLSRPKELYSHGSVLAELLLDNHQNINMDDEGFSRIIDWLDVNAQAYGDYYWNKLEFRKIDVDGEVALRAHIAAVFGENLAQQAIETLVNVGQPDESRILKAPLPVLAGGWGQIVSDWDSTDHANYQQMKELVMKCIIPLKQNNIAGICNNTQKCTCKGCWVAAAEEEYKNKQSKDGK